MVPGGLKAAKKKPGPGTYVLTGDFEKGKKSLSSIWELKLTLSWART